LAGCKYNEIGVTTILIFKETQKSIYFDNKKLEGITAKKAVE
jgi:hypothetical protein